MLLARKTVCLWLLLCLFKVTGAIAQTPSGKMPTANKLYTLIPDFKTVGVKTAKKPDKDDANKTAYIFTNTSNQALICAVDKSGSLIPSPEGYYFGLISIDAKYRIDNINIYGKDAKPAGDSTGVSSMRMVIMKPAELERYMSNDSTGIQFDDTTIVAQHLFNVRGEKILEKSMSIGSYELFQVMLVPEIFPGKKPFAAKR